MPHFHVYLPRPGKQRRKARTAKERQHRDHKYRQLARENGIHGNPTHRPHQEQ